MMSPPSELESDAYVEAERFFKTRHPSTLSPGEDINDYCRLAMSAYSVVLHDPEADRKLAEARNQGILRIKRDDIESHIRPNKTVLRQLFGQRLMQQLVDIAGTLEMRELLKGMEYHFELAYESLRAYNSLRELEAGQCVRMGSVSRVHERW